MRRWRSPPWPKGEGRMARPIMRRLPPLVLVFLAVLALPPASSSAQEAPSVQPTLLSQATWNCPPATEGVAPGQATWSCPTGRQVTVRFRALNLATVPLDELAIGVTLFSRVLTRIAYEASLPSVPSPAVEAEP